MGPGNIGKLSFWAKWCVWSCSNDSNTIISRNSQEASAKRERG
uniref:Uncharacterized protein n=1 Tax=Arundo donax TaxID=35708 RepID=A0A0A9FG71_ARUDO